MALQPPRSETAPPGTKTPETGSPNWETEPIGLRCQSCSRPMPDAGEYGTTGSGAPSLDFCRCCMQAGEWVEPDISPHALIGRCVDVWVAQGADRHEVRGFFERLFPTLRRWRESSR